MIPSVILLANRLAKTSIGQDTANDLVIKLLIEHNFQIAKVDDVLFNLLCLYTADVQQEPRDLSTKDKQNIYAKSRAPIKALNDELHPLEDRLDAIRWDTDSKEFIKLHKRVNNLKEKIKNLQLDVSNDVFAQINSGGSMGVIGNDGKMTIDLHALHVEEAKNMLQEYVFPALPVVRKVIIITGRGSHSKGGKGVLKEEIKVWVLMGLISRSLFGRVIIYARRCREMRGFCCCRWRFRALEEEVLKLHLIDSSFYQRFKKDPASYMLLFFVIAEPSLDFAEI